MLVQYPKNRRNKTSVHPREKTMANHYPGPRATFDNPKNPTKSIWIETSATLGPTPPIDISSRSGEPTCQRL